MNLIRIFLSFILLISSAIMTSEELSDELNYLKSSRSRIRAKCTRNCDYIDNEVDTLSHAELLTKIDFLREIKTKLEGLDSGISKLLHKTQAKKEVVEAEHNKCDGYEDRLQEVLGRLQGAVMARTAPEYSRGRGEPAATSAPSGNQIRLPQIPLPEFNHSDGETFENFITNFEAVIANYTLSNFEKYVYLEKQVKGEAL